MQAELFELVLEKENNNVKTASQLRRCCDDVAQGKVATPGVTDWKPLLPPTGVDRNAANPKLLWFKVLVFDMLRFGFLLPD